MVGWFMNPSKGARSEVRDRALEPPYYPSTPCFDERGYIMFDDVYPLVADALREGMGYQPTITFDTNDDHVIMLSTINAVVLDSGRGATHYHPLLPFRDDWCFVSWIYNA
jgi:hypothetical protein